MQFLESPRTSDQSDLKGSKKHQQPAPGLGKSRRQMGHIGLAIRSLERGDISRLLNSYCADCALAKTAQQISPR